MSPLFTPELRHELEQSGNVTCVVDDALQLLYCNPAWDRFALSNNGQAAVSSRVMGTDLLEVVPKPMRELYERLFAVARETRQMLPLDYQCPSPSLYRLFRMEIRPLGEGSGFVLVHALCVERPHAPAQESFSPDAVLYMNSQGLVVMCAHCRKTRRVAEPEVWDWVPDYLNPSTPRRRISHGLCGTCFAYFYPQPHKLAMARR